MSVSLGAGLEGAGVLVTGAAGGIGRAVAGLFAAEGARVAAHDLDQASVELVVDGLEGAGHVVLSGDLRDPSVPELLAGEAAQALGSLDVLAHVAAVLVRSSDLRDVTIAQYDLQQETNLRAGFLLNRAAAERMRSQGGGGRIINFTSQGWWTGGFGGSVVYSATKGGIVSMTRGLARTYGPDGILINCVAPGAVNTSMFNTGLTEEAFDAFVKQIPLGRVAEPSEIAGVVVFLASDHASYISGATINITGAQLMY